jgi:Transcriptional regulator, AbiEi antitoxin
MARYLAESFSDLVDIQHGVLSRGQAMQAGLTRHEITARLRSGRWQQLHSGVYASFRGQPPRTAVLWAAVLRVGHDATLSHRTAAELAGLVDDQAAAIHVSVSRQTGSLRVRGIVVHYSAHLPSGRHPARTPPQTRIEDTVLDLARLARSAEDAVGWSIRACQRRLTTPDLLRQAMAERVRLRWRGDLAEALTEVRDGVHSPLERRYLRDVERAHGLPAANRQILVVRGPTRAYEDVRYRDYGTCVELDGLVAHPAGSRWLDIRRDNANAADGIITLRYGWADVAYRPCAVAAEVARTLQRRGWDGSLRRCGPSCLA